MPSGFLNKYADQALSLHSQGWRSWAQGEMFQNASEWAHARIHRLPKSTHGSMEILSQKMWRSGEALDHLLGRKIGDKQLLSDIQLCDHGVLQALHNNGFLTHTPKLVYEWAGGGEQTPGQNIPHSDGWGEIKMFVKSSGRLIGSQYSPQSLRHQMNKWLILLHEASHNEFYTSLDIFTPPNHFSEEEVRWINDWGMNRLFCSRSSLMLSEAFADCYGALMLLEGFEHAPESLRAVESLLDLRRQEEQGPQPTTTYCLCASALQKLLDARSEWKGRSPSELKILARQWSSTALMEVGLGAAEHNDVVLNGLIEDKMRIQPFMFEFCLEYIRQTHDTFLKQMDQVYAAIPMWPHLRRICVQMAEDFIESEQSQRPDPLLQVMKSHGDADPHELFGKIQQPLAHYLKRSLIELSADPSFATDWANYTAVRQCIAHKIQQIREPTPVFKRPARAAFNSSTRFKNSV